MERSLIVVLMTDWLSCGQKLELGPGGSAVVFQGVKRQCFSVWFVVLFSPILSSAGH